MIVESFVSSAGLPCPTSCHLSSHVSTSSATRLNTSYRNSLCEECVPILVAMVLRLDCFVFAIRVVTQEVMRKRGLILIDTKYEFGVDDQGRRAA
eukprot:2698827-Amphidinium_carterae.1